MLALRLRWALRDARARWIQFTGIALMIAVGVGMSAALTSITEWRRASIDAGLESTNMYDIRARVSGDGVVPRGGLLEVVQGLDPYSGTLNHPAPHIYAKALILSLTAAEDLGLAVGDSVVVSHTVRTGPGAFAGATSTGLGLALLIAFNTANLNAEERARDHATMFAYGVPLRRVVANLSAEGLLLGLLAMVAGIVFGYALLLWMITELLRGAFAEVGFIVSVDLARVAISMLAAIIVVTVAPTFTARKLRRMNIPSTLRVME